MRQSLGEPKELLRQYDDALRACIRQQLGSDSVEGFATPEGERAFGEAILGRVRLILGDKAEVADIRVYIVSEEEREKLMEQLRSLGYIS